MSFVQLGPEITRDFSQATSREWLETNGLGGWASSTVAGAHTRRYHGLLVVAAQPPVGRLVMLSKIEETLHAPFERLELGCSIYPGAVRPEGYLHLSGFALDPFPVATYASGDLRLRKSIAMLDLEHTTVVVYELLRAPGPVTLELRPLFAGRDYHRLLRANDAASHHAEFSQDVLRYQPYPDQPVIHTLAPGAHFLPGPDWYYNFQYPRESERGLDFSEDLFTCGVLHYLLQPGEPWGLLISTADPQGRDPVGLLATEASRRAGRRLPQAMAHAPLARQLAVAADQFVVRRGERHHTLIAGYPWFTDWGRDTMIALPGICLATGRHAEARGILQAFAAQVSDGMIPNRFPDAGETPDYNTVDATLWMFVALHKYLQYTGDDGFVRAEMWPVLLDVLDWHQRGTRYGIGVDQDGLLQAGVEGVQLTWMDAKVGDWVVTPRPGKPVEINALWYNALRIAAQLAERFGDAGLAGRLQARSEQTARSFEQLLWNPTAGCLYDVVCGANRDPAIRPNQILALSLPFPLLSRERRLQVLDVVERELWTPCGLRSLAPSDPAYCPHYGGSPWERDRAYHQGTVWGWLMGPYLTALVRLRGEAGRRRGLEIVQGLQAHLCEAGLGTISEIFDAEPPHTPRGCIAQAWSVGEVLRAYYEDLLQQGPGP